MATSCTSCCGPGPASATRRTQVIIAGLSALILTVGLARFAYTPMLPVMRAQAGLGDVAAGWLATYNYMGYLLGALFAASVGNLGNKYRLYKIGLAAAVLTTFAMGLTSNMLVWSVLRFLSGISSTAGLLLASGLVLNWLMNNGFKPELGLHFVGLGLGIVVSGAMVALMAGHLAWDGQWLALGCLSAAFCLPAWIWMPAPHIAPTQAGHTAAPTPRRLRISLLEASYFCAGFGYVISATFIVAMLEQVPGLAGKGSWMWVIVGALAAPSCFVWDRIADAMGQTPALLLAFVIQIVAFVLPVLNNGAASNLISAVLYGGTFVGIVSLALSIVGRRAPANPAKAMARLTVGYGVAQIIAPAMTGYMVDSSGSYAGPLGIAAIIMAVGAGLLVCMIVNERTAAPCRNGGKRIE